MSKQSKDLFRDHKFGIRKFTVGVASVIIGTTFYLGVNHEVEAAEQTPSSQSDSNAISSSNETQTNTETTSDNVEDTTTNTKQLLQLLML